MTENKAAQWFAGLPKNLQVNIRALHHPNKHWRWMVILFIVIWISTAILMARYPYFPLQLTGYFIIGAVIHALAISMHECIHGNMFRQQSKDYWSGLFLALPALISCTAYKVTHRLHHLHNRTEKDPDEFTNLSQNKKMLSVGFYIWALIGMPLYMIHIVITAFKHGTRKQKFLVIAEEMFILSFAVSVLWISKITGFFLLVCHSWLIPLLFAMFIANTRAWSEHSMTRAGNPLTQSRTVVSNRLVSLFLCNQNYHLEHHLFPAIPWYNLPKLHVLLQDEYQKANAFIYPSYLNFLWHALKNGVHSELPQESQRLRYWQKSSPG